MQKWVITGTDVSRGSRDLDHAFEWAETKEKAWAQAVAHAAGTHFTPESIEKE